MLTTACGVVLLGVVTAWPAAAQRVGLRAGLSVDPDQFYFGVHAESGPVIDLVRFRPNVEAGFGGNLTVVAFNGEFVYPFELRNGTRLYAGGGPALVVISRDRLGPPPGVDTTNVEPGFEDGAAADRRPVVAEGVSGDGALAVGDGAAAFAGAVVVDRVAGDVAVAPQQRAPGERG
jgi:hypothetical protein